MDARVIEISNKNVKLLLKSKTIRVPKDKLKFDYQIGDTITIYKSNGKYIFTKHMPSSTKIKVVKNEHKITSLKVMLFALSGIALILLSTIIIKSVLDKNNTEKKKTETLDADELEIATTIKYNDAARLDTSLLQYQTNNTGKGKTTLPPIRDSRQIVDGTGNSELDSFYNEYLGNFTSYTGSRYNIQFIDHLDAEKMLGGIDYLNVFYYATCDDDGDLVQSSSKHSYAVVVTDASNSGYYCMGD